MVYECKKYKFIALVVFILNIKKHNFSKYQHIFFSRFFSTKDFIYPWFINVMVYGFKKMYLLL